MSTAKYLTIKNHNKDVFTFNEDLIGVLTNIGYSYSNTRIDQHNLSVMFRVCYDERMLIVHFIEDDLLIQLSNWGAVDSILKNLSDGLTKLNYNVHLGNKLNT